MTTAEIELLLDEIARYLAAVDAFRNEGCTVPWRSEEVERCSIA